MRSILILSPDMPPDDVAAALASGPPAALLRPGGAGEGARVAARAFARGLIAQAGAATAGPRIFVQVAPATGAEIDADLAAIVAPGLQGVFLAECEGRAHVQQLSAKLSVNEAQAGLPAGTVKIVALAAQTPAGVFALGAYRDASARLAGLALDDVPIPGGEAAKATARTLLLLGAASARLPAFDLAPELDGDALVAACALARREGFSGMIARRAAQIPPIERAFRAP